MKKNILIKGMACNHCVKAVRDGLNKIEGVKNVNVDLASGVATVEGDNLKDEVLKEAILDAGYSVIEIK